VSVVHERDDLHAALRKRVHDFRDVFAEQFVAGMEVTVGILGVDRSARALPVLELVPTNEFYDYEAKYTAGMTTFHVPARLSEQVTAHVQDVALRAHQCLGCHGFSRVDMMVDSEGRPFITEVNTLPGLTDLSDLPAQASAAGISYDDLILEILESAFVDRL
jgi:D-alanine-D-alanine ligase